MMKDVVLHTKVYDESNKKQQNTQFICIGYF